MSFGLARRVRGDERHNIRDALPRHLGIRAEALGIADQLFGHGFFYARQADPCMCGQNEQAIHGVAAEVDFDLDRAARNGDAIARGEQAQGAVKTGGVPCREQLLRIRASAWPAQRLGQAQVDVQIAVIGPGNARRPPMAGIATCHGDGG